MEKKKCFKCGIAKPLHDGNFYRHIMMADGYLNKCKECAKKDVAERERRLSETNIEWREKELERHRLKAAKYRAIKNAGKPPRQLLGPWIKRNPHKRQAHIKVGGAIRSGRLIKQPCEVCGETKVEAHHDDYSKPLDVRWLCTTHHAERHVELRRAARLSRI